MTDSPRLSVVITNYNYGHFLAAAITSVLEQSLPVDELIVVDDGSGDDSGTILDSYGDQITAIRKSNGGQASAFNTGFAETGGDLVIFLDADDELEPDASALIKASWDPELAALGYRMNLIDETGTMIGAYPLRPPSGDMRPELLSRGQFPFVPTSGNVFNRARLARYFPLPEARWRISADAVLLRLAAIVGPIRHLDIPLGRYRVHATNNYFRTAEPQQAVRDRSVHDAVDACLDTAEAVEAAYERGMEGVVEAFDLRRAAFSLAVEAFQAGDPQMPLKRVVGIARSLRGSGLPRRAALAAALLPVAVRVIGGRARRLVDPRVRPAVIRNLVDWSLGADFTRIRRNARRSRWLIPVAAVSQPASHPPAQTGFNSFDWLCRDAAMILLHLTGEIVLLPTGAPRAGLCVSFEMEALGSEAVDVEIASSAKRLVIMRVEGTGTLTAILGPEEFGDDGAVTLSISARQAARGWWRLIRPFRPGAVTALRGIGWSPLISDISLPLLAGGDGLAVEDAAGAVDRSPDGTVTLRVASGAAGELELSLGPDQPSGILTATARDDVVLKATVGPDARVLIEPPPMAEDCKDRVSVVLRLEPNEPGHVPEIHLAAIRRPCAKTARPKMLAPGTIYDAGHLAGTGEVFTEGWAAARGVELLDFTGSMTFSVPPALDSSAVLEMAVMLPNAASDIRPRIAVTIGEEVVAGLTISQSSVLRVPLQQAVSRGWRRLDVAVHAAGGTPDRPVRARLRLLSLRLEAGLADLPEISRRARHGTLFSLIADTASALRRSPQRVDDRELAGTAERIDAALLRMAIGGDVLARPQLLEDLLTIGAATAGLTGATVIRVEGAGPEISRALARAMLRSAPWRALDVAPFLDGLTGPLLSHGELIAKYLTSDWHMPETEEELRAYERHVLAIAQWSAFCFSAHPVGSPRYQMADALLRRLRPLPLLFAGQNMRSVDRAVGQAMEAYHLSRDRRITLPLSPGPGPRIRVAALLRQQSDVPETRILDGMLGALPSDTFEITVYTLERENNPRALSPQFRVVPLDWLDTDVAVATIRAAQPHVFWLASHFSCHDDIAAIAAHRIAPLQIATTAVSPATTGLRSFDVMLSDMETARSSFAGHYTERLVLANHRMQRFAASAAPPDRSQARAMLRARFSLPKDAVVLISTAHTDKISQRLLRVWLEILAAVPDACLVLWPFAPNWRLGRSRSTFVTRIEDACADFRVASERVRVEPPVPAATIPGLLAGADLFLDSFPYSGATTVVEALQAGAPVVTLEGETQAGRQGASWVRAWGLGGLVAGTSEAYRDLAVELAGSVQARNSVRADMHPPSNQDRDTYGAALAATIVSLPGVPHPLARPRYVFHHMAKTGGTTCRRVLSDWFDVVMDQQEPWASDPPGPPVDLDELGPEQLLWSHFNPASLQLRQRYPGILADRRFRIITFVRDPLDTALSSYFFECRHRKGYDPDFEPLPIDQHLVSAPLHPLLYHLSSITTDWRTALDRYWFVGTLERMGDCLSWLGEAFGRHVPQDLPWLNRTDRDLVPSPDTIRRFRQQSGLDYEIYQAACARMEATLATDPRKFLAREALPDNGRGRAFRENV